MDGSSAQIPIVMGSISDENPTIVIVGGKEEGFAQLATPNYKFPVIMVMVVLVLLVVQFKLMKSQV